MCESNNKVMYERENLKYVTLKNNTKENTHISYYLIFTFMLESVNLLMMLR
jgi:hypothetical protein